MRDKGDILIVDDEDVVLRGARKILTAEGLAVDVVSSADSAVARMRNDGYRLVMSDLLLPGMDGIDLMLALRRRHNRTPVIIVTGFATLDRAIDSFRNGAFDFLPKPFDTSELMGLVRRALACTGGEAQSVQPDPASPSADRIYSLGQHANVELLQDDRVRVRLGPTFVDLGSDLVSVSLPQPLDEVRQANECARITTRDGSIHRIWSPLSGQVVEPLRIPDRKPDWNRRCLAGTALFVMQPAELDCELRSLTYQRPASGLGASVPKEATW